MQNEVLDRIRRSVCEQRRDGGWDLTFLAMGTRCRVNAAIAASSAAELREAVLTWVAEFESRYSRFLPGSLISRINQNAGVDWVETDPETDLLFQICQELHFITGGVFDPTALPLLRVWDWRSVTVPLPEVVESARAKVGWRKVQRAAGRVFLPEEGMALDLGGVGKEYAVDAVAALAVRMGVRSVLVDFGHDVRVVGTPPDGRPVWHVGLEDAGQPGRCWAGVGVRDMAVATSGDYVRCFKAGGRTYSHIIDVRTGYPIANGCHSVSVLAPTCLLAGALATTGLVLGEKEGLRLMEATARTEGCITTDNGRLATRSFYEHVVS